MPKEVKRIKGERGERKGDVISVHKQVVRLIAVVRAVASSAWPECSSCMPLRRKSKNFDANIDGRKRSDSGER